MDKEDHRRSSDGPKDKDAKHDRHSGTGLDPNPKKGGHGGWGVAGREELVEAVDPNDPNYDPDEHKANN